MYVYICMYSSLFSLGGTYLHIMAVFDMIKLELW